MKKAKQRKRTSRDLAILGRALASEWNHDGVEVLGGARREAGGAPMPEEARGLADHGSWKQRGRARVGICGEAAAQREEREGEKP